MTLSLAKCSAGGGTMDKPGGGLFFEVCGPLPNGLGLSAALWASG